MDEMIRLTKPLSEFPDVETKPTLQPLKFFFRNMQDINSLFLKKNNRV